MIIGERDKVTSDVKEKQKLLDIIYQGLAEADLKPQLVDGYTAYLVIFDKNKNIEGGIAHLNQEAAQFNFYLDIRHKVIVKRRPKVAEFITRANYGLAIGNFEMDYSDGTVRFKSSFCYKGENLSQNMVRNTILIAMSHVETYITALVKVMNGDKIPQEAIEEVE